MRQSCVERVGGVFCLLLAGFSAGPLLASEVPFAATELLLAVEIPSGAKAADVDRDGDLDLIAHSSGDLVWLEQTAGGSPPTFVERALINQGGPFAPVDLDLDGDLDVAMLYQNADDALVLAWAENDGTPDNGAWSRRVIQVWDAPAFGWADGRGPVASDLDGDGDPDLALAHQEWDVFSTDPDGRLLWMRNDGSPGDGGWSEEPLYDWILDRTFNDLLARDLDGDGDLDLVGQSFDEDAAISNGTSWWENDGSPGVGYWTRRVIDSTAISTYGENQVEVCDLDRDGDLDLAVAFSPDPMRWYESDGSPADGGWTEHEVVAASLSGVRAEDIDGDGDLDLAEWSQWLDNDGSPGNGGWTLREGSGTLAMSDLDGDGDRDFFMASQLTAPPGFWWQENLTIHRSARLLDETSVFSPVDAAFDLAAADIDGDGHLDLLSVSEALDRVYWHENRLDVVGGWPTRTITDLADGARAVEAGDLDGDGDLDLASASYNDDTVAWYENDGTPTVGAWTRRVISVGAGGANDIAVADLDGDGDLDVACAQYLDGEISWYRNNGASPPTFGAFFVDSVAYAGPRALAAGDLDGDGDLDLAVVSETDDAVVWYGNDGTPEIGEWARHRTDNGDVDGPKDLALADLDGDGDLDTVVAAYVGDAVVWYENDGTFAGWTMRTLAGFCSGARSVAPADVDDDGDLDVLHSCYDDDAIWLARSNGGSPPGFSSDLISVAADGARTVIAADLDGDGRLDGAVAQGVDDQIAWYENVGGQFRVSGTVIAPEVLANDAPQPVFRAVVAHRGRSGDGSVELSAVAVKLEEVAGDPLSAFQAASLLDAIAVYGDDGNNVFEPGVDPLLASGTAAGIDGDGVVWVDLPDGLAGAAIPAVSQRTVFVVLDLAQPAGVFAPDTVRATLLTEGAKRCEAQDRDFDLALVLEPRTSATTATLTRIDVLFRDGYETGDRSRWSATRP